MVESNDATSEDEPPLRLLLRRAIKSDLLSIVSIECVCFDGEGFNARQFKHMLSSRCSIAFVAQINGEMAGYIWAYTKRSGSKPHGRIYSLGVRPEFRGLGAARKLMAQVELEMKLHKVDKIFLEVSEANKEAIGLYTTAGYEVVGVSPGYYGPADSALKMVKKLVYQ